MQSYQHPRSLPRSLDYALRVNGQPVEVLATDIADFAIVALAPEDLPAAVEVSVLRPGKVGVPTLRPVAKNLSAAVADRVVSFSLARPEKLSVDFNNGTKPLYLFAQPPETNPPAPGAPGVVTFPAGQVTEVPELALEDGQTLYLPGGAVLKGKIHVRGRRGVRVCGHGIVDGSFYSREAGETAQSLCFIGCLDVLVEDVTMVRPSTWMIVLAACERATVRNVKQIGEVICSDGVDIVGSREVLVEDCFLHNNDDCVVLKAFDLATKPGFGPPVDARRDVERVRVRRCTLANWRGGNAIEIGHELSTRHVRDVVFEDIDVLHVHGVGAVFSIHNYDGALVSDIVFENIRIEHCYDKLIDFRVSKSRYSVDAERGRVRNVTLRDIRWTRTPYNLGYTVSMIGGWDADHAVEDVRIENFVVDGERVRHLDELEITTRHCRGLTLS